MLFKKLSLQFYKSYSFSFIKRMKFININQIIKSESIIKQQSNQFSNNVYQHEKLRQNQDQDYMENNEVNYNFNKNKQIKIEHLSTESQQIIYKIKTSIKCNQIYTINQKYFAKLSGKHYALMLCKLLYIRNNNQREKSQSTKYKIFLNQVQKQVQNMTPEDIIKILYSIKKQEIKQEEIVHLQRIIDQIIMQFQDLTRLSKIDQFVPKTSDLISIQTLIKLQHCLMYLLKHTGTHYEKSLTLMIKQIISFVVKNISKSNKQVRKKDLVPFYMQASFLQITKSVQLTEQLIKDIVKNIFHYQQKLNLEVLFKIQQVLFNNQNLFKKLREDMNNSTQTHLLRNLLYKTQKQINNKLSLQQKNLLNLPCNFVDHIQILSNFNHKELQLFQIQKEQQLAKIIKMLKNQYFAHFHQTQETVNFRSQLKKKVEQNERNEVIYHLINFFMKSKKQQNQASKIIKQFHQFLKLMCKNLEKLDFLTSSIILRYLIKIKFQNISSIVTLFSQYNVFTVMENQNEEGKNIYKFHRHQTSYEYFKLMEIFYEFPLNVQHHIKIFLQSSLKYSLRILFRKGIIQNIEQKTYILAKYCGQSKDQIDYVISLYLKGSFANRSFDQKDIELLENQTEQFSSNFEKETVQTMLNQMPNVLQDRSDIYENLFELKQKIGYKLRWCFSRFKFVILFLENIQRRIHQNSPNLQINKTNQYIGSFLTLYFDLLQNFKNQLELLKFYNVFTLQNLADIHQIVSFFQNKKQKELITQPTYQQLKIKQNQSQEQEDKQKQNKKYQNVQQSIQTLLKQIRSDLIIQFYEKEAQQKKIILFKQYVQTIEQFLKLNSGNQEIKTYIQQKLNLINKKNLNHSQKNVHQFIPLTINQYKKLHLNRNKLGHLFQPIKKIQLKKDQFNYKIEFYIKKYLSLKDINLQRNNNQKNMTLIYFIAFKDKVQKKEAKNKRNKYQFKEKIVLTEFKENP